MNVRIFLLIIFFLPRNLCGQAPALRDQLSLNGTWPKGGIVPQYGGIDHFKDQVFERKVDVPASWQSKRCKLEFGAVNFIADIYVNDTLVFNHVGGWNPFSVDITDRIEAGKTFWLKVRVKGPENPPVTDEKGSYQWPVGGWSNKSGIADDVWLRSYGNVHIDDVFIQTSFRKKEISVDYTLINTTTQERTVNIVAKAVRAAGGKRALVFTKKNVTIKAGSTLKVTLAKNWKNPALWWPDRPVLYHLFTKILSEGQKMDAETHRFGFREFWIQGNQFRLNGVRINLYGDYQTFASTYYTKPEIHTPENWLETIDRMKALNIRILRFHHNPVPQYILDAADEKGLLICDESAHYGRKYLKTVDRENYVKNGVAWVQPWIRADRNHPSIYMWNATNEMTYNFVLPFTKQEILEFGDAIRKMDTTRPVGYDGDKDIGGALIDFHYPEGYNKEPVGSIYSWADKVHPDKPTGSGELLHTKSPLPDVQMNVERNTWWLGIWTRGMRYTNWTNVKPSCYWFTQQDLNSPDSLRKVRSINLRNAYAPIALFDKAYDDLGITPFVTGIIPGGTLPILSAGSNISRALVLYNDEFIGDEVKVNVILRSSGKIYAQGNATFKMAPGEHIDIQSDFQVPYISGQQMELIFRTYKFGKLKFEEGRTFKVIGPQRPIHHKTNPKMKIMQVFR